MKSVLSTLVLLLLPVSAHAELTLTGILSIDGQVKAVFQDTTSGKDSPWLAAGGTFNGYTIVTLSLDLASAEVSKDGHTSVIKLQQSKVLESKESAKAPEMADLEKLSAEELHARGYHRTEKGDTGAKIAMRMGVKLADLQSLNPDVKWSRLVVGQIVKFRSAANLPPEPPPTAVPPPAKPEARQP